MDQRFRLALVMSLTAGLVAAAHVQAAKAQIVLTRNAAIGAKFSAPGPRTCSTTAEPRSGALSPEQARAYIICGYEKDYMGGDEQLLLIGQVQVAVGSPRPYEHVRDSLEAIDPRKSVYDIRGRSVTYVCSLPYDGPARPKPQPCRRTVNLNDEGRCYQTTFNDWRCTWGDRTAPLDTDTRTLVAAPSEAEVE